MAGLPPPPKVVTDEEREATYRAQLRRASSMKVMAALQPALVEVRATAQLALKAPPRRDEHMLMTSGTAMELMAAIKAHRRYASSGTLALLGKSPRELSLIYASLEPGRKPTRELTALTSERFMRTARIVERRERYDALQAQAAATAARAAAAGLPKPKAAAAPVNFWERPKNSEEGEGEGEKPRVKSAEQLERERDAHIKAYWKLTDKEALQMAREKYAAQRF